MRAFTLIETVIYIALFAIIFQGALSGILVIETSSQHDQTHARVAEESEFLADKLTHELSHAEMIAAPESGGTGEDVRYMDEDGISTHIFAAANDVFIVRGTGLPQRLNDSEAILHDLRFVYGGQTGSSTDLEYIEYSFQITRAAKETDSYSEKQSHRVYLSL